MWSCTGDQTAGFWSRRQANEVAVHRWDAELAAGDPTPIDNELAADGVDERLDMLRLFDAITGTGETIHLHCTDIDGEWVVTLSDEGPRTERVHAKSDVAVRGTASDLDLFVCGRVDATAFEVFGDAQLLERFQSATHF